MQNNDRVRRSNMVLIGMVVLVLLFGIINRIRTGDNKLYIFGFCIELPFGQQETTQENEAPDSSSRAILRAVEEAMG